jgi:hypothetical protein|tara:strand:+ start:205 stop:570 length:366 start_codon:yes stop_codon:yes gene_type:complete
MALSASLPSLRIQSQMVKQTTATATPDNDVTGGSTTLYMLDINNGAGQKNFIRVWNAGTPVSGTTVPDIIIPVAAGQRQIVAILEGLALGTAFSWCATQSAGTVGAVNPSGGNIAIISLTK